jgi:hypothetical protein
MKINNSFIRWIVRQLLKNERLTSYLKEISTEVDTECIPESDIIEVRLLNCRKSSFNSSRLNLLVPGLSIQHVFGGISTALSFFETLGKGVENLRIIIIDEIDFKLHNNHNYAQWNIRTLEESDVHGFTIVVAGDRQNRTLSVGENDRFIATAWWTATLATHIQQWQFTNYKLNEIIKFVYLIQDFEPGFYPWSSRYALAESTYHNSNQYVAVFNSGFLKSFFDAEGYKFSDAFVFEPTLNPKLRDHLKHEQRFYKERRVIVYGRPSTQRNAFEIIVMALKLWVSNNPGSDWEFVSAGEKHPPVNLGGEKYLTSLGKLSINEYAKELSRASIGVSLMISPHPSYPPLEMAAFGIRTITNQYKGKDLSLLTPNIVSISALNSIELSNALIDCIRRLQINLPKELEKERSATWVEYLESSGGFENIIIKIRPLIFLNQT